MVNIKILPHAEEPRSGVSKHGGWVADFGIWYKSLCPHRVTYGRPAPSSPTAATTDSGSMIPRVRTDSRTLSPSTIKCDTGEVVNYRQSGVTGSTRGELRQIVVIPDSMRHPPAGFGAGEERRVGKLILCDTSERLC